MTGFLCTVEAFKPDIIGITESWTSDEVYDNEITIPGYDLYRKDRNHSHRGGGVLLYVKDSLQSTEFTPKTAFPEQVWCRIPQTSGQDLLVGVCYRTPTSNIFQIDLDETLRQLLTEISCQHVLLMGDFNYGDIKWSSSSSEPTNEASKLFLECLDDCFLTQHVTQPTRITASSSTILDLVITDHPDMVEEMEILGNLENSDHQMLRWTTLLSLQQQDHQGISKDYKKADFDSIRARLLDVDWDNVLSGGVEHSWNEFKNILQDVVEKFVPDCKHRSRGYKKAIWMTYAAVRKVRRKHNLFRRYRDINNPEYIEAAREARAETRRAKRNFEKKLAENIKNDNKSFYAYVRSRSTVKASTGPVLNVSGDLKTDPGEIAEELNTYFSSVFTNEDTQNMPQCTNSRTENQGLLEDIEINEEIVMAKLLKLRSDKATGADDISAMLLTEIRDQICHPLTVIFQMSVQTGEVPNDWKIANVTPIHKKGNRNQPSNYRPISLTSHICKLFESVARDSIVSYLESNRLINDSQHGFRRGRSCLTNLLIFLDQVTRLVDDGNNLDVIYLDFAKAFDKVPHQRLLMKMKNIGIQGRLLDWVASWLSGRRQRVGIRGRYSEWRDVTSGVPQGSVLGPVLFLIFINDIDDGLFSHILKFADDTKIYSTVNNGADQEILQSDLTSLETWSKKWQMEFNTTKCKVLHVGRTNQHFGYILNSQELQSSKEERDLGVIVSNDLKSASNCQAAYNKANQVLGMIRRTIHYKSAEILLPLYKTLVRPLVEYCTPAWSPHYSKDKILLEKIQHRFTRLIPRLKCSDYHTRLDRLNLWTLEQRRNRADLIELFRIYRGLSGIGIDTMFEPVTEGKTRGHSLKLRKHCCHLDLRKFFFSERVINRWNALDEEAVSATSVNSFKNQLQRIRQQQTGFFTDT